MAVPLHCDLCGKPVALESSYVVRIDVFADPSSPAIDTSSMTAAEAATSMADVMRELEKLSADELQDQVHRRFEHRLCAGCHRAYLANPLGKPREARHGFN